MTMPVFPSRDWMEEFCDRLGAQPQAEDVATALDGEYRFVIEPGGPLADRHVYDVAIRPAGGNGRPAIVLDEPAVRPRLTMTAAYPRWRQLIRGELDVRMALLMRRLKVSGDLSAMTGRLDSAQPLVRALGEVDSQWLEA